MNNNISIYPTSESVRNTPLKKTQIIKKQSRALSRSLISEYPGYSLISEPITAHEKHYSLVGYMLTVDIYFLLSNQSARKVLLTCWANTNYNYSMSARALDMVQGKYPTRCVTHNQQGRNFYVSFNSDRSNFSATLGIYGNTVYIIFIDTSYLGL